MTPEQRSIRAKIAANARWARGDTGRSALGPANRAFGASFRSGHGCAICPRIDIPSGLPEQEVERRARALRLAHFGRLSLRSSRVRSKKKAAAAMRQGSALTAEPEGHVPDDRPATER